MRRLSAKHPIRLFAKHKRIPFKITLIALAMLFGSLSFVTQDHADADHINNGPVGYWKLDEGSGTTVADLSGHGNDGTIQSAVSGSPHWVSPGHNGAGSALAFDGTGAYASATNSVNLGNDASLDQLDNYTISIWVKFEPGYVGGGGVWANLFGRTAGSNWAYMIYINSNGTIRPHHRNSNGTFVLTDSTTVMPVGEWVHIEQVADGSNLRLYINGVEDPSFPIAYSGTTMALPAGNVYIGQDTRESAPLATISEVKIFNQAITAPGGVRNGLGAWHKANDGSASGASWSDSSGNGVTVTQGTAGNQPTFVGNSINFNPAFTFDGSNDYLTNNGDIGTHNANTNGEEFFNVSLPNSLPGGWNAIHGLGTNASTRNATYMRFGLNQLNYLSRTTSTTWQVLTNPAATPGITQLGNGSRSNAGAASLRWNGREVHSGTLNLFSTQDFYSIGAYRETAIVGFPFNGRIPETVFYKRQLTAGERSRVNSYLAMKYGITLDQTNQTNYVASDGTTIPWNASTNGVYNNNITGIGRDDSSALNQKQSKSVNSQGIVTVGHGTIESTNLANTNDFSDDMTFLTFGDDNNSATTWASTGVTNTTLTNFQRLPRTWKVQETGTVGNVTIGLDAADLDADVPAPISNYYLLRDSNNDTSFADETPILMTDNGGGQFSVSGVNFSSGELFTFATLSNTYTVIVQVVNNLTGEDGDTGTFKVCLGARPSAAVTIPLSSSNTNEGTVPASITIQPDDWNNCDANVVTVNGVNDSPPSGDGAVPYTIVTGDVASTDANFDALDGSDVDDVNMFNQNDDPAGIVLSIVDNVTGEDGSTARVRFRLLSASSADVVIQLSASDVSEGTLGQASITVTPANWDQPQNNEVVITGVDDALTDGDILYQLVTGEVTSGDAGYDALTGGDIADASITNIDNDSPGIAVTETDGSTDATEGGANDTFTVVPNTQPALGNVVGITVQPDGQVNLGAGPGVAIQLTFDNANWNTPQTVTVTAHDDTVIEDAHSGQMAISVHASTTESSYAAVDPPDLTVQITDNDEDNDGVPAEEENSGPNGGDANEDGTLDSTQRHVVTMVNEITDDYSVLELDNVCQINSVGITGEASQTAPDAYYEYPYGLMNFEASCGTPGYITNVNMYFFGADDNLLLRKHNPNNNSYFNVEGAVLEHVSVAGTEGMKASFQIEDGSVLDMNGTVDGTIIDPAGLALSSASGDLSETGQNNLVIFLVATILIGVSIIIVRSDSYIR